MINRVNKPPKRFILITTVFLALLCILSLFYYHNLSQFAEITRNDPLFYDPNMDVKQLHDSILELKRTENLILTGEQLAFKKSGMENPYPTGWRIWPMAFLDTLPQIHTTTESYLESPSLIEAIKLFILYHKAVDSYKTAINLHIQTLEHAILQKPQLNEKTIIFFGSGTTPQIVLNDFYLIEKNADELKAEINKRLACLTFGFCEYSKINNYKEIDSETIPFKPLPAKALGVDKNPDKVSGPYWTTTGCFGYTTDGKPYRHPFYIFHKQNNVLEPILTNTKFYRDYEKTPDSAMTPVNLAAGIKIRPHTSADDYLCTDLGYLTDLYTQYLTSKNLISKSPNNNKLATLPYLIQHTSNLSTFPIYYTKFRNRPMDPIEFLIARSAYSLYFGTFSKAVWRLSEEPQFLIKQDFSEYLNKSGYSTYQDLINRGMSMTEIKDLNKAPHVDQLLRKTLLKGGL